MITKRTDGLETRRRLLDAAGLCFAEKGFRATTTAEICQSAKANVAAVNYHFRSKEELYVAAWRHEFERSLAAYPPEGGVAADAPPEERLRGHIRANVKRFMDPASRDLDIAHREMASPTGLLAEVIHAALDPLRRMHVAIIRDLLGADATAQDVQLCEMSIHAQCVVALMHERRRRIAPPGPHHAGPPKLTVSGNALAEHIFRFSLAGIREIRGIASLARRSNPRKAVKGLVR
jgi:AcrR family transcriptional regulator